LFFLTHPDGQGVPHPCVARVGTPETHTTILKRQIVNPDFVVPTLSFGKDGTPSNVRSLLKSKPEKAGPHAS